MGGMDGIEVERLPLQQGRGDGNQAICVAGDFRGTRGGGVTPELPVHPTRGERLVSPGQGRGREKARRGGLGSTKGGVVKGRGIGGEKQARGVGASPSQLTVTSLTLSTALSASPLVRACDNAVSAIARDSIPAPVLLR